MFELKIKTANDAFGDEPGEEVARILIEAATAIRRGTREAPLHDYNGNRVGRFELKTRARPK